MTDYTRQNTTAVTMKRIEFIQQTVSVAGLSFVGCGIGGMLAAAEQEAILGGTAARLLGIS